MAAEVKPLGFMELRKQLFNDVCPHRKAKKKGGGPAKPNGRDTQCQCVMCHCGAYVDGTIEQCTKARAKGSNTFCASCEEEHGEKWRSMQKESSK